MNTHAISFNGDGFAISAGGGGECAAPRATMRWSEVRRVTAFKQDWFTFDRICLAMFASDDTMLELDEEMGGWKEFIETLPQHLPGLIPSEEWFSRVAFPAFATNAIELYDRNRVRK